MFQANIQSQSIDTILFMIIRNEIQSWQNIRLMMLPNTNTLQFFNASVYIFLVENW